MKANKKQLEKVNSYFKNNPSAIWDGKFGWHSNGTLICDFYWEFDAQKEMCELKIDKDGRFE